jgi:DNA-directed RNA polymerase subunit H (RpoH/RPB5)
MTGGSLHYAMTPNIHQDDLLAAQLKRKRNPIVKVARHGMISLFTHRE